jgi:hypothetical protein
VSEAMVRVKVLWRFSNLPGRMMATTLFKDATYSVSELVRSIQRGTIALPDIQRPFVWEPSKVRSLFDLMYRQHHGL